MARWIRYSKGRPTDSGGCDPERGYQAAGCSRRAPVEDGTYVHIEDVATLMRVTTDRVIELVSK